MTTEFVTQSGLVAQQSWSGNTIDFFYDAQQRPYAMSYTPAGGRATTYYYLTNLQGDVIALLNSSGGVVAEYEYGAWGDIRSITDGNGAAITSSTHIANLNPLRYRGYYYDTETGFYYLQSRYYDPVIKRFINVDNQIDTTLSAGLNLFAYCANNPVMNSDPTGQAWWHWAIGAALVTACAVATVITCGGVAAAAMAVGMVSSGVAATTTAATVAAGAFISSATVYGVAALSAASDSRSVQDFNSRGSWGTVAATAGAAALGAASAYITPKSATTSSSSANTTSRGSTGRTQAADLTEQLAMEQVRSNPMAGVPLTKITMNDPRWPSTEGWVKMQQIVPTSQGNINIHYVYNQKMGIFDDFKFVP